MSGVVHLQVIGGHDVGRQFTIPPEGARLGRSRNNDLVLDDPLVSGLHCRFFFRAGDGLWLTDLGSANETVVNGKPINECRLHVGDRIVVGETHISVVHDDESARTVATAVAPIIDLGFDREGEVKKEDPAGRKPLLNTRQRVLLVVAALGVMACFAIWLPKLRTPAAAAPAPTDLPGADIPAGPLQLVYEKVLGDTKNIFRYHLALTEADGRLSVEIDDLANHRHVTKETPANMPPAPAQVRELTEMIRKTGFIGLKPEYSGIQPDALEQFTIVAIIGRDHYRVRVAGCKAPEAFEAVREKIESFAQAELGLAAIPFTTEQLVAMAENAYLVGRKAYDERSIHFGNLFEAIRNLQETVVHLETVEPKPDFFRPAQELLTECTTLLQEEYDKYNYDADRAMRIRDWPTAEKALQVILELIPLRSDKRHEQARNKLVEVQRRMGRES